MHLIAKSGPASLPQKMPDVNDLRRHLFEWSVTDCYWWWLVTHPTSCSRSKPTKNKTSTVKADAVTSHLLQVARALVLLLSCAKSHMLSASRRQPHLLHVSAVDRRQTWSMKKSWRCVTFSGFLHSHIVRCRWTCRCPTAFFHAPHLWHCPVNSITMVARSHKYWTTSSATQSCHRQVDNAGWCHHYMMTSFTLLHFAWNRANHCLRDSRRFNFLWHALQWPCPVRKRFSSDHWRLWRSTPGSWIVGSTTKVELTTVADCQSSLHQLVNRTNHYGGTCRQLMSQIGGGKTSNRLRWSIPL